MSQSRYDNDAPVFASMESLEARLLLTTLNAGDFFLYHNSQGSVVRVDLVGGGPVELLSLLDGQLVDLVGVYNGDPSTVVNWPDGEHILDDVSPDGGVTAPTGNWLDAKYDATTTTRFKGSWTEIYAVYFPQADSNTRLIITPIADATKPAPDTAGGTVPWSGTPPLLATWYGDAPEVSAPAGSGGVLVGAIHMPITPETGDPTGKDIAHYVGSAFATDDTDWPALGVFPGGKLDPGITVFSGDIDELVISGTVAGSIELPGNLNTGYIGFLWGEVQGQSNIGNLILRNGGGSVGGGAPESSRIEVVSVINMLETRNGSLYATVLANNRPNLNPLDDVTMELEVYPADKPDITAMLWQQGEINDYTNDTPGTAQFLNSTDGNIIVWGAVGTEGDYYALPLMAGQTITIDGGITQARTMAQINASQSTFLGTSTSVFLYDNAGHLIDTLGYDSVEDQGLGSVGTTQKPITFTAREAGIYYIEVNDAMLGSEYSIFITSGTQASIGAVTVTGDFGPEANSDNIADIYTKKGGDIGAVRITGGSYATRVWAQEGGNLVDFEAGIVGPLVMGFPTTNDIRSDNNIGRVASTAGFFAGVVTAGSPFYNHNAYVQNLYSAGNWDITSDIIVTGSLGVMDVVGTMEGASITLNSDGVGPGGRSDLITVGGDWGGYGMIGVPRLSHSLGGNFGFVRVTGDIFVENADGWVHPASTNPVTDGRTITLNDDGGGHLTIVPAQVPQIDPITGRPVLDIDGKPIINITSVTFAYIPVDDGAGGIIGKLQIDGPASLSVDGVVHLSVLDLTGAAATTDFSIEIKKVTGQVPGRVEIYYLETGDLNSFTTSGAMISGNVGSIATLNIGGSLGSMSGTTGAWLPGFEDAPAAGTATEPQYGWFHGRINGLNVAGDIGQMKVGGALGDLRVAGSVTNLVVNSDNQTTAGGWDGVEGIVWTQDFLGTINVGDGLADDGASDTMRAAILSTGYIGSVLINGPRFVMNNRIFHELNGLIAASGATLPINPDLTSGPAIGRVIGTGGAVDTAVIAGADLDIVTSNLVMFSGAIGTVSFSGVGAAIDGAWIGGDSIGLISTSADSNGIVDSTIKGNNSTGDGIAIGKIIAGGPGMLNDLVIAPNGDIGPVMGSGSVADIIDSTFDAGISIASISARDLQNNTITTPGTVGSITATRDMLDNTMGSGSGGTRGGNGTTVGAVNRIKVGRDFIDNSITVAGLVSSFTVGRDFSLSTFTLQGPDTAYLKSMTVGRNMDGTLVSAGRVGSLVVHGALSADISTVTQGPAGNFGLLQADEGFVGNLSVGGTLTKFVSGGAVGTAPQVPADYSQIFNIYGDLGTLTIVSQGMAGDLYANFNVGGNIGTVSIGGTLYGDIQGNGNLKSLKVKGALGGLLGGMNRGRVDVLGTIGSLKFNTNDDLVADLIMGGSLANITMQGGSIVGDIISRNGSIGNITVKGGDIQGDIQGQSIGNVTVNGGNINGSLKAMKGNIGAISVTDGDINADVTATHGTIAKITVTGGSATAGHTISSTSDIGLVSIKGGDLAADIIAGGRIAGIAITGSDITGKINAQSDIGSIAIDGSISDTSIRSGGTIGSVLARSMNNAVLSSALGMGTVHFTGEIMHSFVLAGVDVGVDGMIATADDNPFNGGLPHAADIKVVQIDGTMTDSVVSAGVASDAAGEFMVPANDVVAAGISRILKMSVNSFALSNGILADTSIDPAFLATIDNPAVVVFAGPGPAMGFHVGTDFGPGSSNTTLSLGLLTMQLTGDGVAWFDDATGNLVLAGITSRSKLTISGEFAMPINISADDDAFLGSLVTSGTVQIGDINIDGTVNQLTISAVADGSDFNLPGGVVKGSVTLGGAGINFTGGTLGTFVFNGDFGSGFFKADSVTSLTVAGSMAADLSITNGTAGRVTVAGDMHNDMSFRNGVTTLTIGGIDSGNITVINGDLGTLNASSLTGATNVEEGFAQNVTLESGFGGQTDSSFRADLGIGRFAVTSGDFQGVMYTSGNITSITVDGDMAGRIGAAGSIASVSLGSMTGGLVAAGGDLTTVKIAGNMDNSVLVAGLDVGDAGFAANANTEDGNVQIDATGPQPVLGANVDRASNGSIKTVTIGGNMTASSIGAAVNPGDDGFLGTDDDFANGTGTIGKVAVRFGIYDSGNANEYFGIIAASNTPTVTSYGRRFITSGNVVVAWLDGMAGNLTITSVDIQFNAFVITFNHRLNLGTITDSSLSLLASVDNDFTTLGDNTDLAGQYTIEYSRDARSLTIRVNQPWSELSVGDFYQLTLDGSVVADNRGNLLDGEYDKTFPTGDGIAGGNFVYETFMGDFADSFVTADTLGAMTLPIDTKLTDFVSNFSTGTDIDIIKFTGNAYDFFSVYIDCLETTSLALFVRDTQGTADPADDTYEAVTSVRSETFLGFELPQDGEYYLALSMDYDFITQPTSYDLSIGMASSDTQLVDMNMVNGTLLPDQIAYVSNTLDQHNNHLGANDPKQLVYVNFDGGTATKYVDESLPAVPVDPFNLRTIDPTLAGKETQLINGGGGVTSIMDNLKSIFTNTPASNPLGKLNVHVIDVNDPTDWSDYLAATDGLWFTNTDPSGMGLDPQTDFTTAFVGEADDYGYFGMGLYGIASTVDLANMSKADNLIVFSQEFADLSSSGTVVGKMNDYSIAFANVIAHELGHTLGLNHQPTDRIDFKLMNDDPDNNPATPDDSNVGNGLMAYTPAAEMVVLSQLGTAKMEHFPMWAMTTSELVGHVDNVEQLLWWLA